MPNINKDAVNLIKLLLTYDPEHRITAAASLKHDYFKELYGSD